MKSNDENTKREMGYHGSNTHGYSLSKKQGKLDQYAEGDAKEKREDQPGT